MPKYKVGDITKLKRIYSPIGKNVILTVGESYYRILFVSSEGNNTISKHEIKSVERMTDLIGKVNSHKISRFYS